MPTMRTTAIESEQLREWYVEQYIRETRLWVYVKGSVGTIEWATRIQRNLEAHGVRARLRMKR